MKKPVCFMLALAGLAMMGAVGVGTAQAADGQKLDRLENIQDYRENRRDRLANRIDRRENRRENRRDRR